MRTTLALDDDVLAAARAMARTSRRSLGSVVSDLARRGLRPAPLAPGDDRSGLPLFAVPDDAPTFGPDDVAGDLDEP